MLAVCLYYLDIASDSGLSSLGSGRWRPEPLRLVQHLSLGPLPGEANTSAEHGVLGSSQPAPPVLSFNLGYLAIMSGGGEAQKEQPGAIVCKQTFETLV